MPAIVEPVSIVLTGGPGAGKTVITHALTTSDLWADWRHEIGGILAVPEAATQIYSARNTRWDRLDLEDRCDTQRAIYHLQREQEERLAGQARALGRRVLLLDRGTIDGSAYWPHGPGAYWDDLCVNGEAELARYAGVIVLQSAAALGSRAYDGDASNAVRFEDATAALESDRVLATLWGSHARIVRISAFEDLSHKITAVADAVRRLVE